MKDPLIKRMASWARTAFAALVLLLFARYGWSAAAWALAADQLPPTATVPSAAPATSASSATVGQTPQTFGPPIRVKLMITAGPDRASLYVDQANVGKTPYVGETSCRTGDTVLIEILPAEGDKLVFNRPCQPGTIRVE